MGTEKLDTGLDQVKIEQTRDKIDPIRFRDETINKVRKENYKFDKKRYLYIPFKVDKDTHFKGLKLKIAKGSPGDKDTQKTFFIQFWFNGRANKHKIARYSQRFGTKECNEYLVDLFNTHTDPATKLWIKDPNETRKNENRFVDKPDTTVAKAYTVNDVIEAYCGAAIHNEEAVKSIM